MRLQDTGSACTRASVEGDELEGQDSPNRAGFVKQPCNLPHVLTSNSVVLHLLTETNFVVKAAAAMAVGIGSLSDPVQLPVSH